MRYLVLYLLLIGLNAFPQSNLDSQQEKTPEECGFCKNNKHIDENPYVKGFKNELPFIITGAGLLSTGFILQSINTSEPFTEAELNNLNADNINCFDKPSVNNYSPQAATTSGIFRVGVLILPAVFLSTHHTRSDLSSLFVMGLEVASITYGITLSAKNIANRPRPYVYNSDVPPDVRTNNNSKKSFFSGHTSFTASFSFYTAKVLTDYHPNMKTGYKIAVWSMAAFIPAVTGYLRVESGKHFPTDVLAGYAVGALTGWLVPHLHKKKRKNTSYSLFPVVYDGTSGLYLSYKF